MHHMKLFEEFQDFDFEKIIRILRKNHGWGIGILCRIDDFESDENYYKSPMDENDYVEQFNIYLNDLESNRLKGTLNKDASLKVGNWNKSVQVLKPNSIWSQRM